VGMTQVQEQNAAPGKQFRLWPGLSALALVILRTVLPCPDLPQRCRVQTPTGTDAEIRM